MNSPLVSIVVNNYNNEKYLKDCVEALLRQTYRNIEIVIVDAFSTDKSRELINKFAHYDSRIKPIFTDSYKKYPSNTFNFGFLNCSGNFIAINDADDISMPTRIEKQLNYLLSHSDVGVVGCNVIEFNNDIERIVLTTVEKNISTSASPARCPTLMFRKSVMADHGMLNWKNEYAADFEWLYRWYCSNVVFFILEEPLVRYRYSHGGNVSVIHAVSQTLKLLKFRIYFGLKYFKLSSINWWITTLKTGYYVCSLIIKKSFRKAFNIKK